MVESSSQNPTSPEITPKEEPITLDKPESPNPFLPAIQVLPDSKIWVSTPTGEVRGEICITIFRNDPRAQYLPQSSMYVSPPSIIIIRSWFATIGYNGEIGEKGTLKKSCLPPRWRLLMGQIIQYLVDYTKIIWEDLIHKLNKKTKEKIVPYPRFISLLLEHMLPKYDKEELTINPTQVFSVHNWILKPNQPKEPPFTDHMKAISNLDVPHAAGGPSSLGVTNEERAHPQLSSGHDALADSTAEADPIIFAHKDSISSKQDMDEGTKTHSFVHIFAGSNPSVLLEDSSDILKDTRSAFFTPDSPTDEPIIISDENEEEEEVKKDKDTKDTLVPPPLSPKSTRIQELMAQVHLLQSQKEELEQAKATAEAEIASMKAKPSFPDINHLTKLLVTSLKPELSKLLASHNFASCLPTELKELPSKFTGLSREIKELKQHIKDMEIELPMDLIEIPTKLEFATMVDNASGAASMKVPLAGQTTASPYKGEKNTKDASTNLKDELIDLLGKDVVT
ncbi:hypothetical protein Tco_0323834 [Tanacetum coccineum]